MEYKFSNEVNPQSIYSLISTMQRRNVVVVGAGIAGIAAVRKLNEDGRSNVKILEASNRIGGRIFSSVIDGIPVELGATYIHGTIDNVIYDLSKQYGIVGENSDKDDDTIDVLANPVLLSNGEVVPNEIVIKCWGKFDELLEDMYTSDKAPMWASIYEDMYAYLSSEYPKRLESDPDTRDVLKAPYSNSMFEFFLNTQSVFEGQENCKGVTIQNDYIDLGGNSVEFRNGHTFSNLLNKLIEDFPKDTILYGREVVNINTESDPILIKCRNGDQFEADHVIITVSLGVLKRRCLDENLLPHECSLFTPALPVEKEEAIRKLGFGEIGKIWLQFEQEISSKHKFESLMMLWLSEDKKDPIILEKFPWASGLYTLDRTANTNLYEAWVHGSTVSQIERASKEEIRDGISYVLGKFLKHPVPKPVDVCMHKWSSDPLIRGSYTVDLISADTPISIAALVEPVKNRVLFAGEATHLEHFATVHGAYLTGMREADRLIKAVW